MENAEGTLLIALADAIYGSVIEKTDHEWIYRQGEAVRARVGMENGLLHGPFQLFYPDGQLWVTGSYSFGNKNNDWDAYSPTMAPSQYTPMRSKGH